jgi:two-component system cell cycle sensor histidine kinase PleC
MAQKNADEGTGLGLPIVRGLVELHGGEFTLSSKVREGTEVIVAFPPERVMNALASLDPNGPTEEEIEAKRVARARRWGRRADAAA